MDNKFSLKLSLLDQPTKEIPLITESKSSGKDYMNYGQYNDFPNYIWELYLRSALLQSVANGTSDYISGNGIIFNTLPIQYQEEINEDGETIEEIIKKISADYMIFGGFALLIIFNHEGNVNELYHIDIRNIRKDEDETKCFYSDKWGKYGCKVVEYEMFDPTKKQNTAIYYFKGHLTRGVYPIPRYVGALAAIETSAEIGKYHLNNILNNLDPGMIINFNNGQPSEEEKKEIEKKINEKFGGSSNAGRTMVAFNENKDSAVTIEKAQDDNKDKKFEILYKNTMKEIFVAWRATPTLFGLQVENNGFSREEFMEAFDLYNKTVVKPAQKDIERCIDKIFQLKGALTLNSFKLVDADDAEIK